MIFKNLNLFFYVNLFSVGVVNAFLVNSSMKEILRTTHVSLSLISLLPIFQEKKRRIGPYCIVYPAKDLLLVMCLVKLVVLTQQTFVGLEDVFKTCLEGVFNTSSAKHFFVFQDVFKTSSRGLEDVLEDEKLLR